VVAIKVIRKELLISCAVTCCVLEDLHRLIVMSIDFLMTKGIESALKLGFFVYGPNINSRTVITKLFRDSNRNIIIHLSQPVTETGYLMFSRQLNLYYTMLITALINRGV
jgi:hypothetical protein